MMSAPANTEDALREFCARIIGYERTQAIEHALRSIRLSAAHSAALLLLGEVDTDLVAVARSLHRRVVGDDQPFVVCDRRLQGESRVAVAAVQAARGGSLCVCRRRLPHDYPAAVPLVRDPTAAVQLIICAETSFDSHPFATLPVPIVVPSIQERANEVPRIVDGYAADAVAALGGYDECFTGYDQAWVIEHAKTLEQIEMATLRFVAIRLAGSTEGAARRLNMPGATLRQWLRRNRRLEAGGQVVATPRSGPATGAQ